VVSPRYDRAFRRWERISGQAEEWAREHPGGTVDEALEALGVPDGQSARAVISTALHLARSEREESPP
jgi:hypothetical protein